MSRPVLALLLAAFIALGTIVLGTITVFGQAPDKP